MPHYKCVACKARLQVWGRPTEPANELCPDCGSSMEAVTELAELVGFRSTQSGNGADDVAGQGVHRSTTPRIDEFVTRRAAILERERFDIEHVTGDDGAPNAEAAVAPPPQTYR